MTVKLECYSPSENEALKWAEQEDRYLLAKRASEEAFWAVREAAADSYEDDDSYDEAYEAAEEAYEAASGY